MRRINSRKLNTESYRNEQNVARIIANSIGNRASVNKINDAVIFINNFIIEEILAGRNIYIENFGIISVYRNASKPRTFWSRRWKKEAKVVTIRVKFILSHAFKAVVRRRLQIAKGTSNARTRKKKD